MVWGVEGVYWGGRGGTRGGEGGWRVEAMEEAVSLWQQAVRPLELWQRGSVRIGQSLCRGDTFVFPFVRARSEVTIAGQRGCCS